MRHLFWAALLASPFCLLTSAAVAQKVIGGKKKKNIEIVYKAYKTDNYEILYEESVPANIVARVGQELEDILEQYTGIFRQKRGKEDEPFRVKFLESFNTYKQEGGRASAAGFYSPASKFLIFYQRRTSDLIPLVYHEAFHQYLHFYMGHHNIPMWFNEGMAEYYEEMQRDVGTKKLNPKKIDFRKLRMVKEKVLTRQEIPFEELIDAGQDKFYSLDGDDMALHYNQSFSVVYFFMEKTRGRAILKYAATLKKTQDVEAANATLFGKNRKKMNGVARQWRAYISKLDTEKVAAR